MVSRLMKLLMMSCILFYLLLLFSGFDAEYGPEMAGERAMNERKDKRRNDRQERIQPALPERAVYHTEENPWHKTSTPTWQSATSSPPSRLRFGQPMVISSWTGSPTK